MFGYRRKPSDERQTLFGERRRPFGKRQSPFGERQRPSDERRKALKPWACTGARYFLLNFLTIYPKITPNFPFADNLLPFFPYFSGQLVFYT
jgi:hypothetical protein